MTSRTRRSRVLPRTWVAPRGSASGPGASSHTTLRGELLRAAVAVAGLVAWGVALFALFDR